MKLSLFIQIIEFCSILPVWETINISQGQWGVEKSKHQHLFSVQYKMMLEDGVVLVSKTLFQQNKDHLPIANLIKPPLTPPPSLLPLHKNIKDCYSDSFPPVWLCSRANI